MPKQKQKSDGENSAPVIPSKSTAPKLSEKEAEALLKTTVTRLKELKETAATAEVLAGVESGHEVLSYVEKTGESITQSVENFAGQLGPESKAQAATLWRYVKVARTYALDTVKELLQDQKSDVEPLTVAMLYECSRAGKGDEKAALAKLKEAQKEHLSAADVRAAQSVAKKKDKTAKKTAAPAEQVVSDPLTAFVDLVLQLGTAAVRVETVIKTISPDDLGGASKAAHRAQRAIDSLCQRLDALRMPPVGDIEDPTGVDPSLAPPSAAPLMLGPG
jgi:chemotaxis protein histidine kinase CheA